MLTGAQLATAITAVLIAAIVLGWVLHWVWARLSRSGNDAAQLAEMVDRLHEADRAREDAEDARRLAETLMAAREAELEGRIAALKARLDGLIQDGDPDLGRAVREARADAEASMSRLRGARRRIAELEAELEALRREHGA